MCYWYKKVKTNTHMTNIIGSKTNKVETVVRMGRIAGMVGQLLVNKNGIPAIEVLDTPI